MLIFESVRGKENARPLLFSALGRDTASPAIVNYLLSPEVGCDVNRPDSLRKLTALQYAIQANVSNEVISILLQHGADPTMRDGTGKSAFLSVVKSSNASTMKLLYGEPLIQALQAHGRHASGRFLLTQDGMDPIMTALKANELQNAEWLLDRFIDLGIPFNTTTSYGLTALHLACNIAAPVAFLEKLVKSGNFDINAKDNLGRIPLCHSMRRMDNMTVDFFRKRNCELDPQMPTTTGSTMIIEACRMGHYLLFIELLKKLKLEDIMKPTWKGMSLFHAACGSKCSDFLQAIFNHIKKMAVTYNEDVDDLTKRFIDPNKSLDDGQSPLYLAAGKPMSVKALLRLGAKFTNDVKFDPLTAAALNCDYQSVCLVTKSQKSLTKCAHPTISTS
jgi:ankyrin repeat protein